MPGYRLAYKFAIVILAAGRSVEPLRKEKNIFIIPASGIVALFI